MAHSSECTGPLRHCPGTLFPPHIGMHMWLCPPPRAILMSHWRGENLCTNAHAPLQTLQCHVGGPRPGDMHGKQRHTIEGTTWGQRNAHGDCLGVLPVRPATANRMRTEECALPLPWCDVVALPDRHPPGVVVVKTPVSYFCRWCELYSCCARRPFSQTGRSHNKQGRMCRDHLPTTMLLAVLGWETGRRTSGPFLLAQF